MIPDEAAWVAEDDFGPPAGAPKSEPTTITVYVCDGCGAKHRQLFLLEHDEDCVTEFWHVESVPRENGRSAE